MGKIPTQATEDSYNHYKSFTAYTTVAIEKTILVPKMVSFQIAHQSENSSPGTIKQFYIQFIHSLWCQLIFHAGSTSDKTAPVKWPLNSATRIAISFIAFRFVKCRSSSPLGVESYALAP